MTTFTQVSSNPTFTYWDQSGNYYTILGGTIERKQGTSSSSLTTSGSITAASNGGVVSTNKITGSVTISVPEGTYVTAQYRGATEGAIGWWRAAAITTYTSSIQFYAWWSLAYDSPISFALTSYNITLSYNGQSGSVTSANWPSSMAWGNGYPISKYIYATYLGQGTVTAPFKVTAYTTYVKAGSTFSYVCYNTIYIKTPKVQTYTFKSDYALNMLATFIGASTDISSYPHPYFPGIYLNVRNTLYCENPDYEMTVSLPNTSFKVIGGSSGYVDFGIYVSLPKDCTYVNAPSSNSYELIKSMTYDTGGSIYSTGNGFKCSVSYLKNNNFRLTYYGDYESSSVLGLSLTMIFSYKCVQNGEIVTYRGRNYMYPTISW